MKIELHGDIILHQHDAEILDILLELVQGQRKIIALLRIITEMEVHEMADLSAITASVANETTVVGSAVTLLSTLSQQIRDLSTDPAALQALADQIDSDTVSLAQAVAANTPAA